MPRGIFTLKQQLQGVQQKAWNTGLGVLPLSSYIGSFNGSSQYLSVASTTALGLGTGNFTIECWVNPSVVSATASDYTFVFDMRSGSNDAPCLTIQEGVFRFQTDLVGNVGLSPTISPWTWYHIAYVRNGGYLYCYVNGNLVNAGGTATTLNNGSSSPITIGARYASAFRYLPGAISNFRVVKGTAVYTSNFTPSTSPLTAITNTALLTLQSATIIDNSGNSLSITNTGSVTTSAGIANVPVTVPVNPTPAVDYLVVAGGGGAGATYSSGGGGGGGVLQGSINVTSNTSYTVTVGGGGAASTVGQNSVFGSITSTGGGKGGNGQTGNPGGDGGSGGGAGSQGTSTSAGGQGVSGQGNTGGGGSPGPGVYGAGGGGGAGTIGLTGTTIAPGAGGGGIASAISGTITAYGGGGGAGSYFAGGGFDIPGGAGGGGTGKYNASGVAGTTNTGGGGGGTGLNSGTGAAGGSGIVIVSYPDIYAAAASTTGSPTVSTSGSGSVALNGSSQYLSFPNNTAFNFGTGDFTVEGWVYPTSTSGTRPIVEIRTSGSNSTGFALVSQSGATTVNVYTNSAFVGASTNSLTTNQWNHVALVRSGNTWTYWINGVSGGSFTNSSTQSDGATTGPKIGGSTTAGELWAGYLSNIRILKGTALYLTTFTPITIPLTAVTNTSLLLNTVSGAQFADSSTNSFAVTATGSPTWNQASPFATGLGYKNRVYTWTSSGSITF
jgi:hypothetical protein